MKRLIVGVIGAGTMGAGIGLTALLARHEIFLFDVSEPVKERAQAYITEQLDKRCRKGSLTQDEVNSLLASFHLVSDLKALSEADIVIEAIPEKMELKKSVFRSLDEIFKADTILATNTSSLSVTVLASATNRPDKVVGCHFFNPAPVMKLIEVIRGEDTSDKTMKSVIAFAKVLGKTPVVCKDTPGFIVNRVARNFYGEALRIVGEGQATISQVDMLMEQGAGFRMGPFRLMDLIGIDVNLDVTKAVYHANHEEARFRPHSLQSRMVDSGRLGRKSGRGFYQYGTEKSAERSLISGQDDSIRFTDSLPCLSKRTVVIGDTPLAEEIVKRIARLCNLDDSECGLVYPSPPPAWDDVLAKWRSDEIEAYLRQKKPEIVFVSLAGSTDSTRKILQAVEHAVHIDTIIGVSLAGLSATKQASWLRHPGRVRGFGMVLPLTDSQAVEWAIPYQCSRIDEKKDVFAETLAALNLEPVLIRDGAGGIQMRILAMVFNEAAFAIHEGISSPQEVDSAMRLGTNYPKGPAEWMDELGISVVLRTLEGLNAELGEDRYRPSVRLRHMEDSITGGFEHGRSLCCQRSTDVDKW